MVDQHLTVEQVRQLCWRKEVCSKFPVEDERFVLLSQTVASVGGIEIFIVSEISRIDRD